MNAFELRFTDLNGLPLVALVKTISDDVLEVFVEERNSRVLISRDANGEYCCRFSNRNCVGWAGGVSEELNKKFGTSAAF